jgi:hypothetical protein
VNTAIRRIVSNAEIKIYFVRVVFMVIMEIKMINFLGVGKCKSFRDFLNKKIADCQCNIDYEKKLNPKVRTEGFECYKNAYKQALEAYDLFEKEKLKCN